MEFDNHVLLVISIGFLISSITVRGSDLSPFWSIADEVKDAYGPILDEAEEAIGPVSSFDLDKAEEALGPIPSLDEAKQALGPISSLDDAKQALSPVLDEAREKLGPISPSTVEEAKSVTTKALDKVEEGIDSIASWISQNKLDVSSFLENAQKEFGPVSSSDFDKAKEALGPISPSLDKAGEALPPISPSLLDEAKEALGPTISPSAVDEAKDALGPVSSEALDEAKKKLGSITSLFTQNKKEISSDSSSISAEAEKASLDEANGSFSHKAVDEAKDKFGSLSSLITQNKEEISSEKELGPTFSSDQSPASPSTLDETEEEIGSISSKAIDEAKETFGSITSFFSQNKVQITYHLGPISSHVSPSNLDEARDAMNSYSDKVLDEAKDKFGSISSFFSQNKEEISSSSSSMIFIDHDVALAIESLIMQGQSNSEAAIEEARKLLSVTETIASPDRGTCVKDCMSNYASCLDSFNKAIEELRARNVELLTDDVSSAEGEISACQKCYIEKKEEKQSSIKDLEEAIIKATRECLNILHHLG